MDKIIIVRHGDYGYDKGGELTEKGRQQMRVLAGLLGQHIAADGNKKIFSSKKRRAEQSAAILSEELGIPVVAESRLCTYDVRMMEEEGEWLYGFLKAQNDLLVAIVVTHIDFANGFPPFFAHKKWGDEPKPLPKKIEEGEAVIIDCTARTLTLIKQPQAP